MITPDEIAAKAARQYLPFLRDWLRGEPFGFVSLPAGAMPNDYAALRNAVAALLDKAKDRRGYGYHVELHSRQTHAHGTQSLPARITIDTPDDLLALCGKRKEFTAFRADVALIRAALPQLDHWLEANVQRVVDEHGAWPELLSVCAYFLAHPRPTLYLRELPIDVHTKFIEQHIGTLRRLLDALLPPEAIAANEAMFERRYGLRYDEPSIRLRFLDRALQARCASPFADISAPASAIATLDLRGQRCVVVENKLTFLTLPALPDAVALLGNGFAVELLATLPWLCDCSIWYWGDLDAQGFQILAQLRARLPQTISIMMDEATLETFRAFVVAGTPAAAAALPHLSPAEHALFAQLATSQLRLEQERISQSYVVEQLSRAIPHTMRHIEEDASISAVLTREGAAHDASE